MARLALRLALVPLLVAVASCLEPTSVLDATLTVHAGAGQTGTVNQPLADSLAVRVVHGNGLPLEDITVTWEVEDGGGSVSPATSLTDADGIAKARRTLGATVGEQTTIARVAGLGFVRISHTATAAP